MMEHVRDAVVEHLALLTPNPNPNPNPNRNPNPNPNRNPNSKQVEYLALLHTDAASLDLRFTGWANVNRRGDSNALHEHVDPDWALSGVAYLSAGGDPSHISPHLPISRRTSPYLATSRHLSLHFPLPRRRPQLRTPLHEAMVPRRGGAHGGARGRGGASAL